MKDGDIDYSRYTGRELREALAGISRDVYPQNYANILAALRSLSERDEVASIKPPAIQAPSQSPGQNAKVILAIGGFLFSALLGLFVGVMSTDSPHYSPVVALVSGLVAFSFLAIFTCLLPLRSYYKSQEKSGSTDGSNR